MKFTFDIETRLVEMPAHQVFAFKRALRILRGDEMELITPIIQRDTSWKEKMRMVSLLIGQEAFEELLMLLPDEFFGRDESGKYTGWSDILRVANQGERDPERLAKQVKRFIDL